MKCPWCGDRFEYQVEGDFTGFYRCLNYYGCARIIVSIYYANKMRMVYNERYLFNPR